MYIRIVKTLLKLDLWGFWLFGCFCGAGLLHLYPSFSQWKDYVKTVTTFDKTDTRR